MMIKKVSWVLNGPTVDATNEKDPNNVKVTHKEFGVWSEEEAVTNSFEFTFEPHSLTAIELIKNQASGVGSLELGYKNKVFVLLLILSFFFNNARMRSLILIGIMNG